MAKGRRLPSVMKNRFATVPSANIRRSSFDRSHAYKTTFNVDYLIPVFVDEVLPGDTFSLTSTHLCRLTTLVQPIMDNLRLDLQFFYVPNRLLWNNWEDFITGGDEPESWTSPNNPADNLYLPQTFSPENGYEEGSIYDYMGLPTKVAGGGFRHCVLPLRAYYVIWNEYFRDQNLQESLPVWTGDADPKVDPSDPSKPSTDETAVPFVYHLQKRGKRWDYFTSCLPALQKHFASVGIGIAGGDSGRLPVQGLAIEGVNPNYTHGTFNPSMVGYTGLGSNPIGIAGSQYGGTLYDANGIIEASDDRYLAGGNFGPSNGNPRVVVSGKTQATFTPTSGSPSVQNFSPITGDNWPIYVDLGSASSVTINALRNAITLQQWYEKNARYGTRYIEQIQGHFGVHAQDYRLQRPEYLGGSKTYISINPTVQSSSTDNTSPQGNLAAYAMSTDSKRLFTKSFVEHGWII